MIHDPRCYDCLLSRVDLEIELANYDKKKKSEIIAHADELIRFLHKTPWTHPMVASALHRAMYQWLNSSDPFYALKKASEEVSIEVLKAVSGRLTGFRELVIASVIGNMFDYGVKDHEISSDFLSYFDQEFEKGLTVDDTDQILPLCNEIVYFTDNCG